MIGYMIRQGYDPVPNRVYACPHGHGWHKTSKAERPKFGG